MYKVTPNEKEEEKSGICARHTTPSGQFAFVIYLFLFLYQGKDFTFLCRSKAAIFHAHKQIMDESVPHQAAREPDFELGGKTEPVRGKGGKSKNPTGRVPSFAISTVTQSEAAGRKAVHSKFRRFCPLLPVSRALAI